MHKAAPDEASPRWRPSWISYGWYAFTVFFWAGVAWRCDDPLGRVIVVCAMAAQWPIIWIWGVITTEKASDAEVAELRERLLRRK